MWRLVSPWGDICKASDAHVFTGSKPAGREAPRSVGHEATDPTYVGAMLLAEDLVSRSPPRPGRGPPRSSPSTPASHPLRPHGGAIQPQRAHLFDHRRRPLGVEAVWRAHIEHMLARRLAGLPGDVQVMFAVRPLGKRQVESWRQSPAPSIRKACCRVWSSRLDASK